MRGWLAGDFLDQPIGSADFLDQPVPVRWLIGNFLDQRRLAPCPRSALRVPRSAFRTPPHSSRRSALLSALAQAGQLLCQLDSLLHSRVCILCQPCALPTSCSIPFIAPPPRFAQVGEFWPIHWVIVVCHRPRRRTHTRPAAQVSRPEGTRLLCRASRPTALGQIMQEFIIWIGLSTFSG